MSKTQPRLGRGLSSIIGPVARRIEPAMPHEPVVPAGAPLSADAPDAGRVVMIELTRIVPNPHQPRTHFDETRLHELAASIRSAGVLQPVVVRPAASGGFELVAGERRWRAAKLVGLASIPAIVRAISDSESCELALIENLQREDLGPIERAQGYQRYLQTFQTSVEALAARLGESRSNITNYLRLLRLPEEIQSALGDGALGMGQARAIAGILDTHRQLAIARMAIRRNLSARQVEALARAGDSEPTSAEALSSGAGHTRVGEVRHVAELERELSAAVGMLVEVKPGRKKNSGSVTIRYTTIEEFERVADCLRRSGA